ncbi:MULTISPECIES: TetR-like C-terminal domain-containing protein [unclassified Microbacterium]|uniref:TetR/AcrR family transcriptional regulator n=1 Tax=unclassified Microbacterium TaxID=2609290 RepID=UPI00214B79E2|nr:MULTISPECIES: TetR-like C-terminal domain-containing protein [unclassified Microbacterium]MCR2809818.1 WHG domain-containing protein [Microbacterium sp. zg.B185]WIM17872.1 TetR-like C-terminal domain-containing protein [Microbacterium sp. zg-B185]
MPTPERTSLAEIVAAGRSILESAGPAKLTMHAVAEQVGVRAPSLYKRVRDRDALLTLVAEETANDLARQLEASDGSIGGLARTYRSFAHRYPQGFRLLFTADGAEAAMARAAVPVLRATGELVGADAALDAARLLTAWATGFVNMELSGSFRLGGDVEQAFAYGLERLTAALGAR